MNPKCSRCGRFCTMIDKAPDGEAGDVFACSVCDRERKYYSTRKPGSGSQCEHCDGVNSWMVRMDYLHGYVCPPCDAVMDLMFDEEKGRP